jgi:hypothetical protein
MRAFFAEAEPSRTWSVGSMADVSRQPEDQLPWELLDQTRRLVRIRWWAAGGILTAVGCTVAAGVVFAAWKFILVLGFILAYNTWI